MTISQEQVGNSAPASCNLTQITRTVVARSNGKYDEEFIDGLVRRTAEQFGDATITDYLHVLVTKEAMDEMRRLRGLTSTLSWPTAGTQNQRRRPHAV
jgi:hypothetical protein